MSSRTSSDDDSMSDELPPARLTWANLREMGVLFRYLWPYRVKFVLAFLCLVLGSALGLAFPALTGTLIDAALQSTQLNNVEDQISSWQQDIDRVALILIVVLAFQAVLAYVRELWLNEVGERSLADLRRDTYAQVIRLPMGFHSQRRVGELASRIVADLTQIHSLLVDATPEFLRQGAILIGGIVLILWTSVQLAALMLAVIPILILTAALLGLLLQVLSKEAQDRLAESNVVVEETLQNIASVKAFTNERYEEGRYRLSLDEFIRVVLSSARYQGLLVAGITFTLFSAIVLVLWYGTRQVRAGEMSIGELTRFMLYTFYVSGSFGVFTHLYSQLRKALGATQRVRELLREPPEFVELAEPVAQSTKDAQATAAVEKPPRCRGEVRFELVHFRYPSRPDVEVLRGVSLTAQPGERIALVGPSGAGKTTVVGLLLRFYAPNSGSVLVDGQDISTYDLHNYRMQLAIVPQEVILFGGTIAENIAYGRPGATVSEIERAAQQANAHEFIQTFPEGYGTKVGERGVQLSGGQRQRIAIARAILRDPAILILDEATSSLDSESESLVLQALERLMVGRTSVVIAHRLSTVRSADQIYVLDGGQTVQSGTHEELLAQEGIYRKLSMLQNQGMELAQT